MPQTKPSTTRRAEQPSRRRWPRRRAGGYNWSREDSHFMRIRMWGPGQGCRAHGGCPGRSPGSWTAGVRQRYCHCSASPVRWTARGHWQQPEVAGRSVSGESEASAAARAGSVPGSVSARALSAREHPGPAVTDPAPSFPAARYLAHGAGAICGLLAALSAADLLRPSGCDEVTF
jgi:hypothetical protein